MQRCFSSAFAALILLTGLFGPVSLCGGMKNTASYLDTDGIEFSVTGSKAWQKTAAYWQQALDEMVWENGLEDDEIRSLLIDLNIGKLLISLSGIQDADSVGYSSSVLSEKLIHNRIFLNISPSSPGLINKFPAAENRLDTINKIRLLPENTCFAVFADIHPEALLDALAETGELGERFFNIFPSNFPLRELLAGSSGQWSMLLINDAGTPCGKITLPDPENKLFNIAGFLATEKSDSRLVIGDCILIKNGKELVFYASENDEQAFIKSPTVRIKQHYPDLFKRLPEKSVIICFIDRRQNEPDKIQAGKLKLSVNRATHPEIIAVTREKDGFLTVINSSENMLTIQSSTIGFAASLFSVEDMLKMEGYKTNLPPNTQTVKNENKTVECSCQNILNEAVKISGDAPLAPGFYNLTNDTVSAASGKNHAFVSFGRISSVPAAPLLIAKPHDNQVCILFADGQFEKYILVNPVKYKRVAGFLQTVRMYDETIFRQLIDIAEKLDSERGE